MLAFREWRLRVTKSDMRPVLQSTARNTLWLSGTLTSDELPELDGHMGTRHGIHGAVPDSSTTFLNASRPRLMGVCVVGAIDVWGRVVHHADGCIRAEHARVLALRVLWPAWRCASGCDRYLLIEPGSAEANPGPIEPYYALRKPCNTTQCGTLMGAGYYPWKVSGEMMGAEIERLLRERYEVPRLAEGEGPWPAPIGARKEERVRDAGTA